jgi:hypothetical protein
VKQHRESQVKKKVQASKDQTESTNHKLNYLSGSALWPVDKVKKAAQCGETCVYWMLLRKNG